MGIKTLAALVEQLTWDIESAERHMLEALDKLKGDVAGPDPANAMAWSEHLFTNAAELKVKRYLLAGVDEVRKNRPDLITDKAVIDVLREEMHAEVIRRAADTSQSTSPCRNLSETKVREVMAGLFSRMGGLLS